MYMLAPVEASKIISEETFPGAFSVIDDEISVLQIDGAYEREQEVRNNVKIVFEPMDASGADINGQQLLR